MARRTAVRVEDVRTQHMVAMPVQEKVRPAFTVQRITEQREHRVHIFDKKTNRIKSKVVYEPGGFLVTFAKGHSIRCRDEDHLRRIGAHLRLVPLVNEDGEVKGTVPNNVEIMDDVDVDDVIEATMK